MYCSEGKTELKCQPQPQPNVIISKTKKKLMVKRKKQINKVKPTSISVSTYMNTMRDNEKQVYDIAREHLESSFNIEKSNGYQEYLKRNL